MFIVNGFFFIHFMGQGETIIRSNDKIKRKLIQLWQFINQFGSTTKFQLKCIYIVIEVNVREVLAE